MTGLEKITSRIVAQAESEAAQILEAADKKCTEIYEKYEKLAIEEAEKIAERSSSECAGIIAAAKSTVVINRRNTLLSAKRELLDSVFEAAEDQILLLSHGEYFDMLVTVLIKALKEGFAVENNAEPVIFLNADDKGKYGHELLSRAAKRNIGEKIGREAFERLTISSETIDIKGGFILRFGGFDINCSIEEMMKDLRPEIEGRIASLLFKNEDKK